MYNPLATTESNYHELQREWLKKLSHMDRLLLVLSEVDELEKRAESEKQFNVLRLLLHDAESFTNILNQIELPIPLLDATKRKLAGVRQLISEKYKLHTNVTRAQLGERISQLEMAPEADLRIASIVAKVGNLCHTVDLLS